MRKDVYIICKHFIMLLLFTTPLLQAGSGDFAGGLVGGMAGSMFGSAITQPKRTHTTVVTRGGGVSYADLEGLKNAIRHDFIRINDKINDNADDIRKLKDMRSDVKELQFQLDRLKKSVDQVVESALSGDEKNKISNDFKGLKLEINNIKKRIEDLNKKVSVE